MSHSAILLTSKVQELFGRAALYKLLALAFGYPDNESLEELDSFIQDVKSHETANELGLMPRIKSLEEALDATTEQELASAHTRLFARDVTCSAHETEYYPDAFVKARQLADISGFYKAFGLKLAERERGLPDFIATELEFMSLLALKQAYAAVQLWTEQEEVTVDAQRSFLTDHLGCWIPAFRNTMAGQEASGAEFYRSAADLCQEFVGKDVEGIGASPQYVTPRPRWTADSETFSCGLATEIAEEPGAGEL